MSIFGKKKLADLFRTLTGAGASVELRDVQPIEAPIANGSGAANDEVRARLATLGDDGQAPRHVRHFAYPGFMGPPHTQSGEAVRARLSEMGFDPFAAQDNGFRFDETCSVTGAAFDARTDALGAMLYDAGWRYDGWEAAVVAPQKGMT